MIRKKNTKTILLNFRYAANNKPLNTEHVLNESGKKWVKDTYCSVPKTSMISLPILMKGSVKYKCTK